MDAIVESAYPFLQSFPHHRLCIVPPPSCCRALIAIVSVGPDRLSSSKPGVLD